MITVRYTIETSLYGVVVLNKVARTSVERGSIKRKVRHIFRDHVTDNPTGFVIVVQVLDVKKFNPSEIKNKISKKGMSQKKSSGSFLFSYKN